jgi:hypothetical protein
MKEGGRTGAAASTSNWFADTFEHFNEVLKREGVAP